MLYYYILFLYIFIKFLTYTILFISAKSVKKFKMLKFRRFFENIWNLVYIFLEFGAVIDILKAGG